MRINKVRLTWTPVVAQDLAGYFVYVGKGHVPDYASEKFGLLSSVNEVVVPDAAPEIFTGSELFYIGVSAYDNTGNESDISVATDPFDFTAPPAPSQVSWQVI